MTDQQKEYKDLIENFIHKYSPLSIGDLVNVKSFNVVDRPYEIIKIDIAQDGEFFYTLTSPRSHSILPNKFKMNDLVIFNHS